MFNVRCMIIFDPFVVSEVNYAFKHAFFYIIPLAVTCIFKIPFKLYYRLSIRREDIHLGYMTPRYPIYADDIIAIA